MEDFDLISLLMHAPRWVRVALSIGMVFWSLATSITLFLRAVPEQRFLLLEASWPGGARFFRGLRKFGTDWIPFFKDMAMAVVLTVRRAPVVPPPAVVLLCVLGSASLLACSATRVEVQTNLAHQTANAWNDVGRPTLVQAYELDQRTALDRVCPAASAPCAVLPMQEAVATVRAQWAPIWALTEGVRQAHDLWRTELETCRHAGDAAAGCTPNVERLGRGFMLRVNAWRCSLGAVGHRELDVLPGLSQCAAGGEADAG